MKSMACLVSFAGSVIVCFGSDCCYWFVGVFDVFRDPRRDID